MEKTIELRLNKSEFERMLEYALIGIHVKASGKEPGARDVELLGLLFGMAKVYGLNDLYSIKEGETDVGEKTMKRIEKYVENYNTFLLTEMTRELEREMRKKAGDF